MKSAKPICDKKDAFTLGVSVDSVLTLALTLEKNTLISKALKSKELTLASKIKWGLDRFKSVTAHTRYELELKISIRLVF